MHFMLCTSLHKNKLLSHILNTAESGRHAVSSVEANMPFNPAASAKSALRGLRLRHETAQVVLWETLAHQ